MSVTHIFCSQCGASVNGNSQFCQKCGARLAYKEPITPDMHFKESTKSGKVALFLCIFFGIFGIHRFYVGKIGTGILAMLTCGCLGIWTLIDLILIIQNKFKDHKGNVLVLDSQVSMTRKLGWIIGSLLFWVIITISALAIFATYLTSGLVSTAQDQLVAIRAGDISKAYSYYAPEYQKAISLPSFTKWVEEFPELRNNKYISFDARGVNNYKGFLDSGFLEGTLTSKDNSTLRIKYEFIKENGVWKILNITIQNKELKP